MAKSAGPEGEAGREAWLTLVGLVYPPPFLAIARDHGLSPAAFGAMRMLDEPRTMSEIASFLHCDNSNVTGIVDRLEDRGLVERRSATHDRRVKMLAVTPRGAEVRERLAERLEQAPEPLARLSPEDQRTLRDIMRRALEQS
jgi:DNA-binding MarR family transcriptional regulator